MEVKVGLSRLKESSKQLPLRLVELLRREYGVEVTQTTDEEAAVAIKNKDGAPSKRAVKDAIRRLLYKLGVGGEFRVISLGAERLEVSRRRPGR